MGADYGRGLFKQLQETIEQVEKLTSEIREIKSVTDSLTEQWDNDYDLVVMNPPFISWELMKNKKNKDAVLAILVSCYY